MYVKDYEEESMLDIGIDIESQNETLSITNGLISNSNKDVLLEFTSNIENPFTYGKKIEL